MLKYKLEYGTKITNFPDDICEKANIPPGI